MAWLWTSWKEYVDTIHPHSVRAGLHQEAELDSWFETEQCLFQAIQELKRALHSLYHIGFEGDGPSRPPTQPSTIDQAEELVVELIHAGEVVLLYHKRLAMDEAADGFLHSHDLHEHWERYRATGHRLSIEINRLVGETYKLFAGYQKLMKEDNNFLVDGLELPDELAGDFLIARNLFSIGFDDVGVLIAGRGLEGVLRRIAHFRKIILNVKGKMIPASEASIYDLIEAMHRVRWRVRGTPLVTSEVKALLHYLRTLRNESVHSGKHGRQHTTSPRETAAMVAATANQLWKEATGTRARLETTTINKDW